MGFCELFFFQFNDKLTPKAHYAMVFKLCFPIGNQCTVVRYTLAGHTHLYMGGDY